MLSLLLLAAAGDTTGGGTLDTQTVTSAQTGSLPNRVRGYISGSQGSISDGTSNIFGSGAITEMYFDEGTGNFLLTITGATDSSWTTMTNVTDGTSLSRASRATFASGTWTWTGETIAGFFGTATGTKTVNFT